MKRISVPYAAATLLVFCALLFCIFPAKTIKTVELLEIDQVTAYAANKHKNRAFRPVFLCSIYFFLIQ